MQDVLETPGDARWRTLNQGGLQGESKDEMEIARKVGRCTFIQDEMQDLTATKGSTNLHRQRWPSEDVMTSGSASLRRQRGPTGQCNASTAPAARRTNRGAAR